MEESALRSLAGSMGMKKSDSASREEVEFYIIDTEAEASAKEYSEKGNAAPKKKRGRKSKKEKEAEAALAVAETDASTSEQGVKATPDAAETEAPKPKKRGRKSKKEKEEEARRLLATSDDAQAEVSVTDAPPTAPEVAPQPKKRGRKPKQKQVELPAVIEQPQLPLFDPAESNKDMESTEGNAADTSQSETKPQQPAEGTENTNRRHDTPSLGAFFNPTKKFTRRSAQEREMAEKAIATAPILLEEPKPEPLENMPRKDNKHGRQKYRNQQQVQHVNPEPFDFNGLVDSVGVLELMPDGYGFLRSSDYNYLSSPDDVYVPQQIIKQYGLKTGDVIECTIRPPREGEKYFPMSKILRVNGLNPVSVRDRVPFEHLVPLFPEEKFDITGGTTGNISTRIVDMFAPIGKGQRALIVAPPKTGKTILLKDIANAIAENNPETYIIMLLIDERPEEVTDMARSVNAEVIASTFDEPAERHVKIAGIVLEKAKRLVECGHDVVIMLDSITRLARAYNTVSPASGKILSGGVDANALQRPKRFFGAARNIENGGSLTIIATALTETSSKMDEVIFEEFKGTGNMELQLDRKLSNKRLFPAVDIISSSTRREDLLTNQEILNRMYLLRNHIADMNPVEALEFIKKQMEMTRSNFDILHNMDKY